MCADLFFCYVTDEVIYYPTTNSYCEAISNCESSCLGCAFCALTLPQWRLIFKKQCNAALQMKCKTLCWCQFRDPSQKISLSCLLSCSLFLSSSHPSLLDPAFALSLLYWGMIFTSLLMVSTKHRKEACKTIFPLQQCCQHSSLEATLHSAFM